MSRVISQQQVRSANFGGVLVDPTLFLGGSTAANKQVARSGATGQRKTAVKLTPGEAKELRSESQPSRPAFFCAILLLLFTLAMVVQAQVARANVPVPVVQPSGARQLVVVRSGDSIWSIARSIKPTGDVRSIVDEIVAERGSSVVFVGDVLSVPVP